MNAINPKDRQLNCVGCHIPIQRTGQSPAGLKVATDVGAEHLSFVWAPIFSDLLLHQMPAIDAERFSELPRDVSVISRLSPKDKGKDKGGVFSTFDLPHNLADDLQRSESAGRGSAVPHGAVDGIGQDRPAVS